jgi:TPP-dependent 2-oxoacid decarboxylase
MVAIKIGDYLINRLKEVGIDTIFGVPGDYNMVSFDSNSNYQIMKLIYSIALVGYNRR